MAEFDEVCPLEGMSAPLKVRHDLGQLFDRWLPRRRHQRVVVISDDMIDELSLLALVQHYRLEYPGSIKDIAKIWDESTERIADGGPNFDDLVRLGWVVFDGGRWVMLSTPAGTFSHITYPSPSTKAFLTGLSKARLVAKTDSPPAEAQVLATRIVAEGWLDQHIPTKDPDWLAGRLWERLSPKPQLDSGGNNGKTPQAAGSSKNGACDSSALLEADANAIDSAFLEWCAWCDVLGSVGRWDYGWGDAEMLYCREAAHRALARQTIWGTWDNDAAQYADVLEKTFAIPKRFLQFASFKRIAPPRTLVSRDDWLKRTEIECLMMQRLGKSTARFAFGLLCSELKMWGIGPVIRAEAESVILFAADHPIALQQLIYRVKTAPALLVDMLMHQRSACLAAKLAVGWRPESRWDSDRNVTREAQTKSFVVQDALSLLAYHIDKGVLDLEECAALVTWCYDDNASDRVAKRTFGRRLLRMIAEENQETQSAVLQHLVDQAACESNVPLARFSAVLDGLECLSNAPDVDVSSIIELYTKFARDLHLEWTDVSHLSVELSARLIATAFSETAVNRDALLVPFDSGKLLREAPEDARQSLRSSIAQTLRGHVRLLARAVAGWPEGAVPKELCDALQLLISRSVIEHAEKGRVGALTDMYGSGHFFAREVGSPACDLAAAWRRLDGSAKKAMLQALAQSDDPVLLAELCQNLPAAAKPDIQARLRQLKPGEASAFWSWPELQRRIASLIAADECALAREYLDEVQQDLVRAPPQFRLSFHGLGLQLLLKEKNWDALDVAVVPSEMDERTTRQAQDQLVFYRATSQLVRPNGDLAGAEVALRRLAARPGAASAYKDNVFAVAVQQVLGPTLSPLTGENKMTGERLLAEIDAAIAGNESVDCSSSLLANRALLMLALQRPDDALESVAARRQEMRSIDLEIVAVLAKIEMGVRSGAMEILDAAITEFGTDDRLIALKKDLQAGDAAPSIASASIVIDSISSIRVALQQLTELLPSQVGDVLGPPGYGLRGYLTRQVSRAVASLQHMAAMLRDRKNTEDKAKLEDDLNTAVREVLGASLAVVKWDVADQSLGGSTANGTPGERDAVIRVSSQEISIYEALVCSGLERANIKKHFDKLLSYGVCDLYFLVTYSYAKEVGHLVEYLEEMLEHDAPPGLTYLAREFVGPPDYETSGYIATYRADRREVAVVFLVVDLAVR